MVNLIYPPKHEAHHVLTKRTLNFMCDHLINQLFSTRIFHETFFCLCPSKSKYCLGDVISMEHNPAKTMWGFIWCPQGWFCLNMGGGKVQNLKIETPLLQQGRLVWLFGMCQYSTVYNLKIKTTPFQKR